MHVIDAHPVIACPIIAMTIAQIIPIKLNALTTNPKLTIIEIGFIDKLVIPSKANPNILLKG